MKKHGLENKAVEILGMEMATDFSSTFEENSSIKVVIELIFIKFHCTVCILEMQLAHIQTKLFLLANEYNFLFQCRDL